MPWFGMGYSYTMLEILFDYLHNFGCQHQVFVLISSPSMSNSTLLFVLLESVSIDNEYEYENESISYSYLLSFL